MRSFLFFPPPASHRLSLVAAFLLATSFVSAATYYVSPSGDDGNPGTTDQPFRTVQRGVTQAVAGDTIVLGDGVYGNEGKISDGTGGYNGYATPVTIGSAGISSAWITLKAQNRGQAILDCGTTATQLGCDKNIYLTGGAAYWSFQDLVLTGGAFGGLGTDEGASNINVTGCFFQNIGNWNDPTQIGEEGLGFDESASNWTVQGNVFTHIGRVGGMQLDHGIYAKGSNITVINNVFYNLTAGWSIQLADGASNWLIANNTFAFPNPAKNGQIMMWNSNTNITIRNNIFYSPNNWAVDRYTSTVSGCWVDHNVVYGAGTMMADNTGCQVSNNMLNTNPQVVSAATLDMELQPGSSVIGTGMALAQVANDFLGLPRANSNDPGAYRFTPPATFQIVNTTTGQSTWNIGEQWSVTITGGLPNAAVAVTVGNWSGVVGSTDGSGSFSTSGIAAAGNVGTTTELWTVAGAMVNPGLVTITVAP